MLWKHIEKSPDTNQHMLVTMEWRDHPFRHPYRLVISEGFEGLLSSPLTSSTSLNWGCCAGGWHLQYGRGLHWEGSPRVRVVGKYRGKWRRTWAKQQNRFLCWGVTRDVHCVNLATPKPSIFCDARWKLIYNSFLFFLCPIVSFGSGLELMLNILFWVRKGVRVAFLGKADTCFGKQTHRIVGSFC